MGGGSKKGERRGGARPGRIRKPGKPASVHKGAKLRRGRPRGSEDKSKFHAEVGVILDKRRTPLERETELEMYFLAVGRRMRLPKEVMLDAMRYFEEMGIEWADVVRANLRKLGEAETDEERTALERAIEFAETRVREHILMAVDVAYKAAPYLHPRLAAIITNPGSGDSPLNAVAQLFRDLDEAGRAPRYIDAEYSDISGTEGQK